MFNPDNNEKLSTKELNIVYNCIDFNITLFNAYKSLQTKHPKLWYKLNHDDLEKSYKFYYIFKKLQQKRIDLKIKKIVPAYTPEIMEMGQKLSEILLEKSMPLGVGVLLFNHHLHQSDHVSFADPAGCSSYGAPHHVGLAARACIDTSTHAS